MQTISQKELMFLLNQAVKAPSIYNSQAWLFKINDNGFDLYPDYERGVRHADPENRGLFVSLGCVVENIFQAARDEGYWAKIAISSKSSVHISFSRRQGSEDDFLPLFRDLLKEDSNEKLGAFIDDRKSRHGTFDRASIDQKYLAKLEKITLDFGVKYYIWQKSDPAFVLFSSLLRQSCEKVKSEPWIVTELKSYLRLNRKQELSSKDGLSYRVLGLPPLPELLGRWLTPLIFNGKTMAKNELHGLQSSSHLVAFTIVANDIVALINLGRSLQRFLLLLTSLGIGYRFLFQTCATEAEGKNLANALGLAAPEQVGIVLCLGYGKPIKASLRRDPQSMII